MADGAPSVVVPEPTVVVGAPSVVVRKERVVVRKERVVVRQKRAALHKKRAALREKRAALREKRAALREKRAALRQKRAALREKRATLRQKRAALRQERAALREESRSPATATERSIMPTFPELYDVAVIGAGLGGTSAALALARRGFRVALLEAGRAGRHKVCGEFLSPESRATFARLGVARDIEAAGAISIERARILTGRRAGAPLAFGAPGFALSRQALRCPDVARLSA